MNCQSNDITAREHSTPSSVKPNGTDRRILMIGATGVLGRPVARALIKRGFEVHVLARNERAARRKLPASCTVHHGDLRHEAELERIMRGHHTLYINLSHPFVEHEAYDADRDGTVAVVRAAKRAGVSHLVRLSALGVPEGARDWWVIARKAAADEAVMSAGLDYTLFRADWFMETLPQLVFGPFLLSPPAPNEKFGWISGADYGEQVATALTHPHGRNRIYPVVGPEQVSLGEAAVRFANAYGKRLTIVPMPERLLNVLATRWPPGEYFRRVVEHTVRWTLDHPHEETWRELGAPQSTIETYARSISATGDFPRRPLF
jgi:uncharacterized protein YbjT (DUF2867 family)